MNRTMLLIICCIVLLASSSAQISSVCSPVGTWYGGGDYKYTGTISYNGNGTFSMLFEGAYSLAAFGYTAGTSFSSQLHSVGPKRYVAYGVALFTTSPELLPPINSYELDAIRGWVEMTDCDHLQIKYDFFAAYFDLNKVPFVDQPDLNYLPPGGMVETYQRMPTKCPACNAVGAAPVAVRPKR